MGRESTDAGKDYEARFEALLKKHGLTYTKSYEIMTMTGIRRIDFLVSSRFGKALFECKYRDPEGQIAGKRYVSSELFTLMYEYRKLFPNETMIAVVNDLGILRPGNQNYIPLLASIGVEVFTFTKDGVPDKHLDRRLDELAAV